MIVGVGNCQSLTEKSKKQVAEQLIKHLKENYVLQDSVAFIVPKIKESYRDEEFKTVQTAEAYAIYLTQLLRTITQDAHFAFIYNPQLSNLLGQVQDGNNSSLNEQLDTQLAALGGNSGSSKKNNFYFKKAEILKGNIGYLKLEQIPSLEASQPTLDAAMAFLSNTDSFILDLRGNRGGAGGFIPYLMSYFFPKGKQLLYKREMPAPAWDSISYHYTHEQINGKRRDKTPIYILVDQITGSAATNLAYTMQSFGRAKIIGENTGSGYRGAHSASLFPLQNGLLALIPIGKVVNAKTNTNWRAEGVNPDLPTSSSEALNVAHIKALENLLKMESEESHKQYLERVLAQKRKPKAETNQTNSTLEQYVGSYEGGRTVWVEEEKLKYQKIGGSPLDLKIQEQHVFKIHLPSNGTTSSSLPSVKFNMASNGFAESLLLIFEDGRTPQGPYKKEN